MAATETRQAKSGLMALTIAAALGLLVGLAATRQPHAEAEAAGVAPAAAPAPRLSPNHAAAPVKAVAEAAPPAEVPETAEAAPEDDPDAEPDAEAAAEEDEGTLAGVASFDVHLDGDKDAPPRERPAPRAVVDDVSAEAALPMQPMSGEVGYILVDLSNRTVLERRNAEQAFIPASVSKMPTALYALDALGPDFQFETGLYADGDIANGVLNGDLYLVGSGDPTLDTGDLAELAKALKAMGVNRVAGAFYYDPTALPTSAQIEPNQPVFAPYNPSIAGLNLNFNRVLMKWERVKEGVYSMDLLAYAARWSTRAATVIGGFLGDDQKGPIYRYERTTERDDPSAPLLEMESWRVQKRILGKSGQRWFPVQRPGIYAATTFQNVAAEHDVLLPNPRLGVLPGGPVLIATQRSAPLSRMIASMLLHSTNLTAEAVGMAASKARGLHTVDFSASGALMSSWVNARFGLDRWGEAGATHFGNHSGLASDSRLTPRAAVEMLANAAPDEAGLDRFRRLMPPYRGRTTSRNATVRAKTGTIYFGRGLAGYIDCKNGGHYAFAYFNSDIDRRDRYDAALDPASTARPTGSSTWLARARQIERKLLEIWTKRQCG